MSGGTSRTPLRRYAAFYRESRVRILGFLALAVLQFLLAAPLPFIVKEVFDSAIGERRLGLLVGLAGLLLTLQVTSIAVGVAAGYWVLRISTDAVRDLRRAVFSKLHELSIRFLETRPVGDLHDRVVHETERIDVMTRDGLAVAVPSTIFATGILGVLVFIDWALFAFTVALVPVAYAVNRLTRRAMRSATQGLHRSIEALSDKTLTVLRSMRHVRVLGAEEQLRHAEDEVVDASASAGLRVGIVHRSHQAANLIVVAVWVALILALGGAWVIEGRLTLGELFSFYAGLALIRPPLDRLVKSVPAVVAGTEALDRVFDLLDADDPRPYSGDRRLDVRGRLSVEHVSFAYEEGDPALTDVSFTVAPGEVVALVGPNGSGKTTLAALVLGLYRPAVGRITMDGVDYRELDVRHLRRQFGVVTQDPFMVAGTVRDNIVFGRPDIAAADLERAVELAGAGHMLREFDSGLDTWAFENGPLLSGGQLQRVALARALLGRPRLLILDEPSNHLDVDGVRSLLGVLEALDDRPAMILITHEREVASMADTLFRLENGRIIRAVESRFDRPRPQPESGSA